MLENIEPAPKVSIKHEVRPAVNFDGNEGDAVTPGYSEEPENFDEFLVDAGLDPTEIEVIPPGAVGNAGTGIGSLLIALLSAKRSRVLTYLNCWRMQIKTTRKKSREKLTHLLLLFSGQTYRWARLTF